MFVPGRRIALKRLLRVSERSVLRKSSSKPEKLDSSHFTFLTESDNTSIDSTLPFDRRRHSESFGQLVRSEYLEQAGNLNDSEPTFIKKIELVPSDYDFPPSPFRNADGSFIHGESAEEARLDPLTLQGKVDHSVSALPEDISKVISNNILRLVSPDKLRERVALVYQSMEKEQIQKAPDLSLDSDAHIAALFLQDYAHVRRVLLELKSRVGSSFNPQSVLDVGYGPATGMVALNEIMGEAYEATTKEAYIVGRSNNEMKKRAKIILSRQLCETPEEEEVLAEGKDVEVAEEAQEVDEEFNAFDEEFEPEEGAEEGAEEGEVEDASSLDYIGPVDASRIKIRTRLRDALPTTKQYELIIVNQALLTREYNFPKDVDINLHMLLRLLKPNGHLVLVERGNALGFEIIARARQIMLRPESFTTETGKIPRPYIKGSSIKPQKLRREDQIINEDHIEYEEDLLASMEAEDAAELEDKTEAEIEAEQQANALIEDEIINKFGEVTAEDLKFEFEDNEDFELISPKDQPENLGSESVDYHLSVVAPCPHHGRCPLQLGDPKFYNISNHKHRLSFCSFNHVVERPRYTMELKKGRRLATLWDKSAQDGFGLDKIPRNTLKKMAGSGRPGGNNTESGNFSYLIMHRSRNDVDSIQKIEAERDHRELKPLEISTWPRILEFPTKIKNNVKLQVCSPSGNVEMWQVPKSLGKQTYHDARKAKEGDLWALEKKGVVVKNFLSEEKLEKLSKLAMSQRKFVLKEKRKKETKKMVSMSEEAFDDPEALNDLYATKLEISKKYKTQGKKAFDVDPREYDGK